MVDLIIESVLEILFSVLTTGTCSLPNAHFSPKAVYKVAMAGNVEALHNVIVIDTDSEDGDFPINSPGADSGFENATLHVANWTPDTSNETTPLTYYNPALTDASWDTSMLLNLQDDRTQPRDMTEAIALITSQSPSTAQPVAGLETELHLITDSTTLYRLFSNKVLDVFPNIDRDFLKSLYDKRVNAFGPQKSAAPQDDMSEGVILEILDTENYPKVEPKEKSKKRKRPPTEEELDREEEKKWVSHRPYRLSSADLRQR